MSGNIKLCRSYDSASISDTVMSDTETTEKLKLDAAETERIIRDLVLKGEISMEHLDIVPEHFDRKITSKSYHFCALCGRTLAPNERMDNHLSGKKTHNLKMQSPKAVALVNFSKGVMEKIKSAHINLDLIPQPETEDGQRIHKAYLHQLRNFGVPMSGKKKEPVPSSASIARAAQSIAIALTPRQRALPSPHGGRTHRQHQSPYRFRSDDEMDEDVPVHDAGNAIKPQYLITSINDSNYTGGQAVHQLFQKPAPLEMVFDHAKDDPSFYQTEYTPNEASPGWMYDAKRTLELWRKLKVGEHPILQEYEEYLKMKTKKSSAAGVNAYLGYIARYALVCMRARGRLGEKLSVDDVLFSCSFIMFFFDRLDKAGVSVPVRMNFMKSLRNMTKWIELYADPVYLGGQRLEMCSTMNTRLRYILTELKTKAKVESAIANVAKEPTKKPVLYCVARAIVSHYCITTEVEKIVRKVRTEGKEVSHAEYNFVLGAIFLGITVFNTTRNEAMYKSINATFLTSRDTLGREIQGTGLMKIKEKEWEYYIAAYPNPKQARGMKTRSSVLGGLFVLNEALYKLLQHYIFLRRHRAVRLKIEKSFEEPRAPFFLKFDGKEVDLYTVPWMMQSVLRMINCKEEISCNTVRHATATLQYDQYVSKMMSGGADESSAFLAGHKTSTQLNDYTDDVKKIDLVGFKKLEELSSTEAKNSGDAVKLAIKSICLKKKLTSFDELVEAEENEEDDKNQLLNDVEVSDFEEDQEIENLGSQFRKTSGESTERIGEPQAKRRPNLRVRTEQAKALVEGEEGDTSQSSSLDSSSNDDDFQPRKKAPVVARRGTNEKKGEADESVDVVIEDPVYQTLMKQLNLDDDEGVREGDDIKLLIKQHNDKDIKGEPVFSMTGSDMIDFKRRRYHRKVQDFPWTAVRKRSDGQFGLFAKMDIPAHAVVLDYRGRTLLSEDHYKNRENASPEEVEKMKAYYFEHKIDFKGKPVRFGIEAHHLVYDGTVVLGRFLNHSLCCANLEPKLHKEIRGSKIEIFIYFVSKKNIKKGEELLWNYGPHYSNTDWYRKCTCKIADPIVSDTFGPLDYSAESTSEAQARGPSMSQSAVEAPFRMLPLHDRSESLFDLVHSSTAHKQLYLYASVPKDADYISAIRAGREAFGDKELIIKFPKNQKKDVNRILAVMADQLDNEESSILVLKSGQGFETAVALIIGDFDVKTFLIYREEPRQFITLGGQPNRRGDKPIQDLMKDVPTRRLSVGELESLIKNDDVGFEERVRLLRRRI